MISIFLLKARVSYSTISERKNLSLPLRNETDQFVTCLVLPVSFCQNCISPSNSEANRDGADAESPFPLFFSFSASFKNSSPKRKGRKLSSFWEWWVESLFLSIIVAKYLNIFPHANDGRSPLVSKAICSRLQRESALSRFGARVRTRTLLNLIAWLC